MEKTIVLKNASLLTETGECIPSRDLTVADGRIASISPAGEKPAPEGAEVIDCGRYFVSPGIANLHSHTAMNIFKGIAEDVPPDAWFNERIFPYESRMSGEDIYAGTLLGIAEMLDNGVTAFADHYFGEEMVLRAVKETGIRCDLAPTVFGTSPDYRERLAAVSGFIREHRDDSDRIGFFMGAHSNYLCPPPTLEEIVSEAKKLQVPLHLHLAEEETQVVRSEEQFGVTPFEALQDAGGFDLKVLVAHGLWIQEEDLEYLREDTWFAFCPKTYMKLAMGRGDFFRFSDRLNYGFGTDGAASSNTLNPVEQARLFGLLEKFQKSNACARPAKEIWTRLMSGHRALSFDSGRMEEGAPADLVIWDLFTPDTFAFYDPVSAILYSSNSRNVRYTMVGGEFLKYDGKLKLDTEELFRDAMRLQKELLERGKGRAKVFY